MWTQALTFAAMLVNNNDILCFRALAVCLQESGKNPHILQNGLCMPICLGLVLSFLKQEVLASARHGQRVCTKLDRLMV